MNEFCGNKDVSDNRRQLALRQPLPDKKINSNDRCKFTGDRIWRAYWRRCQSKFHVDTQNLCPSSTRFQIFLTLTNENVHLRQKLCNNILGISKILTYILGNTTASHHHNRQHISDTIFSNQIEPTTIMECMCFCATICFCTHSS